MSDGIKDFLEGKTERVRDFWDGYTDGNMLPQRNHHLVSGGRKLREHGNQFDYYLDIDPEPAFLDAYYLLSDTGKATSVIGGGLGFLPFFLMTDHFFGCIEKFQDYKPEDKIDNTLYAKRRNKLFWPYHKSTELVGDYFVENDIQNSSNEFYEALKRLDEDAAEDFRKENL